jgi:hypothetical protein
VGLSVKKENQPTCFFFDFWVSGRFLLGLMQLLGYCFSISAQQKFGNLVTHEM